MAKRANGTDERKPCYCWGAQVCKVCNPAAIELAARLRAIPDDTLRRITETVKKL